MRRILMPVIVLCMLAVPSTAFAGDYGDEYKTVCYEGKTLRLPYYEAKKLVYYKGAEWGECRNPCPEKPVPTPIPTPGPVGPAGPQGPPGPAGPPGPTAPEEPVLTPPLPPKPTTPKCDYRIRLITPKARHGVRPFGGRIIGTRGRIVQTTMVAVAISPGRSPLNGRARAYPIKWRGGVGHVWLYDETIWRHRLAWGRYRLTFKFTVKDGTGTCVETRTVRWFNHDPGGLPS
jgi:hypothetical protein